MGRGHDQSWRNRISEWGDSDGRTYFYLSMFICHYPHRFGGVVLLWLPYLLFAIQR